MNYKEQIVEQRNKINEANEVIMNVKDQVKQAINELDIQKKELKHVLSL